MTIQATGELRIQAQTCCVLFDPDDGEIRHVHHAVTIEGAAVKSQEAVEARARELARESGLGDKGLHALHVDASELELGQAYRVDPEKRRLVKRRESGRKPGGPR
jgi:hypothetical protein